MLLAPNGKPSNLTAEQYKLVRTPEFRGWFGFWDIYYNKFALNYYDLGVKETAHKLKKLDAEAIEKASIFLSKQVSSEDVLITMPSRSGCPTDTKNLANAIAKKTNAKIFNCLIGRERESVYNLKKQGADISNFDFDFSVVGKIPKGRKYFIVDNVIGTGASMKNAMQVIIDNVGQNVFPLVYAIDPNKISKVVDENGEPLVVYHYSRSSEYFTTFKNVSESKEIGVHFGSKEQASKNIIEGESAIKFEAYLNIKNPISVNDIQFWNSSYIENNILIPNKISYEKSKKGFMGRMTTSIDNILNALKIAKIDGFIYLNEYEGVGLSYCVLYPEQIKLSDGSNTTFDGSNPDIRFKNGGEITLLKNKVKAPKLGKLYGQDVEPTGYFAIEKKTDIFDSNPNYETKNVRFFNPLYVEVDEDTLISWKTELSKKYKAKGKKLTEKLINAGYDIIITRYSNGDTGEIIVLKTDILNMEQGGELAMGIKAEMEHKETIDKFKRAGVSDKDVATSIAKDHLKEDPKYYTKLMKIEEKLALGGALLERKFAVGGNVNIQPIRQLGTGANVYFETPFYRLNDNTKDKYTLLVGLLNSGGYMYEYAYYYDNIEIPMFVVRELAKIYPNGVPDAVLIDKFVDTLEKKWSGEEEVERDSDEDIEIVEMEEHGISLNVSDYKNPYLLNRAIEELLDYRIQENYTPDEINFISYYSGYGGLDKMGTFSDEEIKGLLYEFYTPDEVVQKMWGLAYKYGYGAIGDNSVFEPSVGIGAFLKYAPENVYVAANEINKYSAMICEILYPNVQTTLMPFEKNFISKNLSMRKNIEGLKKYSLVIGNPPYGKLGDKVGIYMPMGEDKYSGAANWAEYFLFRGIDLLQKDGLLIYVIGAEQYNGGSLFLDSPLTKTKKAIFEKADLIDAYRLPNKIFERTGVSSEIVIFRKR